LDKERKHAEGIIQEAPLVEEIDVVKEQNEQLPAEKSRAHLRKQAHDDLLKRNWKSAVAEYQQLIELEGPEEELLVDFACSLDGAGLYEQLLSVSEAILSLASNSAAGLAYKARALQKHERLSEATIANDQALLLDSNLPLAWVNRSGLQLLQQKFVEALRSAQRAVELDPEDARAWANKGMALLNFQHLTEALDDFDRSLSCDPEFLFSLQMRGEILCKMGRMREVAENAQQALQLSPSDISSLTQATMAFRALEMYGNLKDATWELIKQLPDSLFAWENYMRSRRGLGEYEEANTALDHILELDPRNVRFWTMKADTLFRLDRYREAVNAAERAVRIDQDYPPAHRIREKAVKMMYQRKGKRSVIQRNPQG
jgi:tetratricopeptide (TPR) repeat protein